MISSTIRNIMKNEIISIKETQLVLDAVKIMKNKNIGAILIVGEDKKLNGIFSERDVYSRVVCEEKDPATTPLAEVMTKNPKTIPSDTLVSEAFKISQNGNFRHIPIVDEEKLVGILSARDIISAFFEEKEALDKMKKDFSMITTHELMTPIMIIRGYMDMLSDTSLGELSEQQKSALQVMNDYLGNLEKIKTDLSNAYSNNMTVFENEVELTDIKSLIEKIVQEIMPFVKKRNQELSVIFQEKTPSILLKKRSIKLALTNIILNAIRFTDDGGKISIRVQGNNTVIQIEIEDTGIGISKEHQELIFESFYEVQDTMNHKSGTIEFQSGGMGLGLTIAKNIISSHKGEIYVESLLGKGSNFTVLLPNTA